MFAARTLTDKENPRSIQDRHEGFMPRIVSEDEGKAWRELPPIGGRISKDDLFRNSMTFSSIMAASDVSPINGSPLSGPLALAFGADVKCYLALREGDALLLRAFESQYAHALRWHW